MARIEKHMKASDLFVRALENEGVEYIFGVPGEENLDLVESLRESSIKLILTRHEQGAGFMAATYGRLTGKTGVCLATLGPGATNFVTCAAYANLGGFPMLMVTGQKPIKSSKQGRFQIVDIVSLMTPITKMSRQIVNVNTIPSLIREAFRIAEEERPGAVLLELPEDIAAEHTDAAHIFEPHTIKRPDCDESALNTAVELIKSARHPLLLIGGGANRKRAIDALSDFVNQTKIPFVTTQMGKGVVGGHHPLYIGTTALSDGDFVHNALEHADVIINCGHDVIEKPPFFMQHGERRKVIHINFDSAQIDEVYFPHLELVGDIASSFRRLTMRLNAQDSHDFSYFDKVRKAVGKVIADDAGDERYPAIPQRIVSDIRRLMPPDGILALDNGMYKIWFARCYKAHEPNTLLLDNALATMGAGLPSAMAAALINPTKRVMAVCGDGGFMMNSQEVETAVRMKLSLVILILRDDSYGMIRWKQAGAGFKDWGLTYNNPDFVAYANSYGATGHRLTKADDIIPVIENCYQEGGVHIVEVSIDYSQNVRELIEDLGENAVIPK